MATWPATLIRTTAVVELDVLNDWKKHGFAGNALMGFADPTPGNLDEVRQSIALFGGVYIGLSLPLTAQTQNVWDVAPDRSSRSRAGKLGRPLRVCAQVRSRGFTCITWGQLKTMTVAFWNKYCDEAHTLLAADWLTANGAPSGFDQVQLEADLQAIV